MKKLKSKGIKNMDNKMYHSLLNLKEALGETTDGVKSRAGELITELLEDFQEKSTDYQHELEEYIMDKPLKSMGLAIGFGILIGKFIL